MKISLITVSYNSESTIKFTLDSIARQDHENIEYIVIDGGSSDKTMNIVKQYSYLNLHYVSERDDGIYDAMNKGVSLSTGEVIGILNSDDFYLSSTVISEVDKIFSKNPHLDVVLGAVDFVEDGNLDHPIRRYAAGNFRPWMFRFGLMPPHPAVFIRKTAYKRVGLYKKNYKIAADFDFLIRLLMLDRAPYKVVNKVWVRMRIGGVSTSGWKTMLLITHEMKRALKENGILSNKFFLLCRLPFKLVTQVIGR